MGSEMCIRDSPTPQEHRRPQKPSQPPARAAASRQHRQRRSKSSPPPPDRRGHSPYAMRAYKDASRQAQEPSPLTPSQEPAANPTASPPPRNSAQQQAPSCQLSPPRGAAFPRTRTTSSKACTTGCSNFSNSSRRGRTSYHYSKQKQGAAKGRHSLQRPPRHPSTRRAPPRCRGAAQCRDARQGARRLQLSLIHI